MLFWLPSSSRSFLYLAEFEEFFVLLLVLKLHQFASPIHEIRFLALMVSVLPQTVKYARTLDTLCKTANKVRCAFLVILLNFNIYCHTWA